MTKNLVERSGALDRLQAMVDYMAALGNSLPNNVGQNEIKEDIETATRLAYEALDDLRIMLSSIDSSEILRQAFKGAGIEVNFVECKKEENKNDNKSN